MTVNVNTSGELLSDLLQLLSAHWLMVEFLGHF
jgi:hypothetical protein